MPITRRQAILALIITAGCAVAAASEAVVTPVPGEHPRLFFRKADLPGIRAKAETADGRAIVARLRHQLDGGDGRSLPGTRSERTGSEDTPAETSRRPVGPCYTLWHAAGYGMLYQLTGDELYAQLGRQATQMALDGVRDRDGRYAFRKPSGALRAGPAVAAVAMGYDLCYDGWDDAFRRQVATAIQDYDEKPATGCSIAQLAHGSRHGPRSNHWGPQVGGAAIALAAIHGDPGTDPTKTTPLLDAAIACVGQQLGEGMGPRGFFKEGLGAGQIASDTAFVPALQALRVSGWKDYTSDERAQWQTLRWPMLLVSDPRSPFYPNPVAASSYGSHWFMRDGLSRGGQFAQGLGAVPARYQAALLWTYEHVIRPSEGGLYRDAGLKGCE